ncbi:MAG: glycine--tRNA ligase subunit beta [Polyangiales bacterium]
MPHDLLLEIGCEELPSSFVAGARAALPGLLTQRLEALRLTHGEALAFGAPRRLAILVRDVADRQPDLEEEVTGPPVAVAYDKEGKPTKGAEAFAKKLGVDVAALRTLETPKGKYVAGTRKETGRPTAELLPKTLAELFPQIPFRKSMRWGAGEVAFGRPIHWIVALLGDTEIPVEYASVKSGRTSLGHRFLAPAPVSIATAADYLGALRPAHVYPDVAERTALMNERLHARAKAIGGTLLDDPFLVDENVGLVEEPFVIDGSFDEAFLSLPRKLIVDVMRTHQRYFAVTQEQGDLSTMMPRYLAVVNTAKDEPRIRKGNDTTLRARLADARFFVETDRKVGLDAYAAKLEGIRYHAKLGTVADKSQRIERVARLILERLQLTAPEATVAVQRVMRAAKWCKADLASLTVGEFPEMQGHAGLDMAQAAGVDDDVARAIAEHWLEPSDMQGAVTSTGLLLGLADKFDHLVGGFAVGLAPTGTNDPFSMRRAFLRALTAYFKWPGNQASAPPLPSLIRIAEYAYQAYMESAHPLPKGWPDLEKELVAFMKGRLVSTFDETVQLGSNAVGELAKLRAPRDVVEACIEADAPDKARTTFDDLGDLRARIASFPDARGTPAFARLATAFKRASKITKDVAPGEPDPAKFDHPAEKALWSAYAEARGVIARATESGDYRKAVEATSKALADPIDTFFDKDRGVFVMADDLAVRDNRLRMLATIAGALRRVARLELLEGSA